MKYGIAYANRAPDTFEGEEAAGQARAALAYRRAHMQSGETLALYSESESGFRSTLEIVTIH